MSRAPRPWLRAPFEILARSGVFNVYSVAPERVAIPLMPGPARGPSGLDFVPHLSFADYDAVIGAAPDVIVVPNLPGYTPERDAAVLDWIRAHFGPRTTLLGICDGTTIVADTGLANGHLATTNPADFDYVETHAPSATWLHNLRYVDDGAVVTSSAVASGIDATLHVVDRFAGRATALDVARQLGYTHTVALDVQDVVCRAGAEDRAVTERIPVRAALQLRYAPTSRPCSGGTRRNASAKQQVVAAWAAQHPQWPAEDIYQNVGSGERAYDVSFADIGRTHNGILARSIATELLYAGASQVPGSSWPVAEVLTALTLSLMGAAFAFGATHRRAPRPAHRSRRNPGVIHGHSESGVPEQQTKSRPRLRHRPIDGHSIECERFRQRCESQVPGRYVGCREHTGS